MANTSYSTADDYMANGWYPGKKHGVGKRLLQGASMGIYNPDNRDESEYNKRILANKVQNAAARERAEDVMTITEKQRQLAMSNLERELTRMGIPPEQIQHISAASLGGGQDAMTSVAEGRAREEGAKRNELVAVGGQVGASQQGASDTSAKTALNKSQEAIAKELGAEADANMGAGRPAAKAKNSTSAENFNYNRNLTNLKKNQLESDLFDTTADITMDTGILNANNAFTEANLAGTKNKSGQMMADAMVDEITSPGMARVYTKANLNKASAQPVGLGSRSYQPDGTVLEGNLSSYDVIDSGDGRRIPVRATKAPGMSTAEPAPAGVTGSLGTITYDEKTKRFVPKAKN